MSANGRADAACVYYRCSDDKQENSIARQRSQVEPYAKSRGYTVVSEYVDEGIPGDEFEKRIEFQKLLRAAQKGEFGTIVVDESSRLSRLEAIDFIALVVHPLRAAGVVVDVVGKGITDWNSIGGQVTTVVNAHTTNEESRNISYRVLTGHLKRALAGDWTGGVAPYALKVLRDQDGKAFLVPGDEEEVRVLRWIFDKIANHGWTVRMVCLELQARAVLPPRGNGHGRQKDKPFWHRTCVRRLIRNKKYIGCMTWNNTPVGKYSQYTGGRAVKEPRRRKRDDADVVLVEQRITPLIDPDLFARANAVLAANKDNKSPKQQGEGRYLFTHLLVCGHCGGWMLGHKAHSGELTYVCGEYDRHGRARCTCNTIPEKPLRDLLVRTIRKEYLNPARLDELEREMRRQLEEDRVSGEEEAIRRRLAEIDKDVKLAGVNMARAGSQEVLDGIGAAVRGWNDEKQKLLARQKHLRGGDKDIERLIAEAKRQLWQLSESIDSADPALVRAVFVQIVEKVELYFDTWQAGKRTKCRFARGVVYLKPGTPISSLDLSPETDPSICRREPGCDRRCGKRGRDDAEERPSSGRPDRPRRQGQCRWPPVEGHS
jgi:DNA invertase Pin-like site-specific DNA recombinase